MRSTKREEVIQARLERARQLYIEGDIDRARYDCEKLECQARLTDLRPVNYFIFSIAKQVCREKHRSNQNLGREAAQQR